MARSSPLLQLAKVVAKDMARGGESQGLRDIGGALASHPESTMEVLQLLNVESRKKRPYPGLISAFLFMLQQALEETRWRLENQSSEATDLIDKVRTAITEAARQDQFASELLLKLAQCFAAAKLDIGDDVRQILGAGVQQLPQGREAQGKGADFEAEFGKIAKDLEHNPFLIQAQMAESFAGLPVEQKIELISMFAFCNVPSLREAAAGWLLSPNVSVALAVANFLAQAAAKGLVSGLTVNRLVTLRNWVHDDRRAAIDATIRAARQYGGANAALSPVQIGQIMATSCDGAGAQSIFVVTRQKRQHSAACLLVKHGFGIRDAWVAHGMANAEVDALLGQVEFGVGGWSASLDAVQTILAHGLAINARTSEPIPFAVLQFIEAVGIPAVIPAYLEPEQLIDNLLGDITVERQSKVAISRALASSKRWQNEFMWVSSWFDDSDAVLTAARTEKTIKARTEVVLRGIVDGRRRRWAELLAWNALAARDDGDIDEWVDLALVAKQLLGNRPIAEIPLAVTIARNCVLATADRL